MLAALPEWVLRLFEWKFRSEKKLCTSNHTHCFNLFKWVGCNLQIRSKLYLENIGNERNSFAIRIDWFLSLFLANSSNIGQYSQFPRRERPNPSLYWRKINIGNLLVQDKYEKFIGGRYILEIVLPSNLGQCMLLLAIASRERGGNSADNHSNILQSWCFMHFFSKRCLPPPSPVCICDNTIGTIGIDIEKRENPHCTLGPTIHF